ncbi:hypothetical protein CAOG_003578 [Capsaspora owczarzaki ATCC 30864]|uniref:RNA polymerase I-specific transcription initiation factor RRN3 n=2 Tax=Capsaspora owczarzaki (strain ATCC 30864) TaxID=595528 RepID=A0A0D2X2J3_CAPO3|nr:hypothetical protein CAOG_003578 [Capsaspora owczarzaki ATCC 30864]
MLKPNAQPRRTGQAASSAPPLSHLQASHQSAHHSRVASAVATASHASNKSSHGKGRSTTPASPPKRSRTSSSSSDAHTARVQASSSDAISSSSTSSSSDLDDSDDEAMRATPTRTRIAQTSSSVSGRATQQQQQHLLPQTTATLPQSQSPSTPHGAEIVGAYIVEAIAERQSGNPQRYKDLIAKVAMARENAKSDPTAMERWLQGLTVCVSVLNEKCHELVNAALSVEWVGQNDEFVETYIVFLDMLLSAHAFYAIPSLKLLVRGFFPRSDLDTNLTSSAAAVAAAAGAVAAAAAVESHTTEAAASLHQPPPPPPPTESTAASAGNSGPLPLPADNTFAIAALNVVSQRTHIAISTVIARVPTSLGTLMAAICDAFPHRRKSANDHEAFLRNILVLSLYIPLLREQIVELTIDRMLKIDVEIPADQDDDADDGDDDDDDDDDDDEDDDDEEVDDENDEADDGEDNESDANDESDNDESASDDSDDSDEDGSAVTAPERLSPAMEMVQKMDGMMHLLFEYIDTCRLAVSGDLIVYELFTILLRNFEHRILPTHRSRFVQFLLFRICSFDPRLAELFLGFILQKALVEGGHTAIRQSAASYMASFVARAKYLPLPMVCKCLEVSCNWLLQYIEVHEHKVASAELVNVAQHSVFFYTCQAAMYTFCYRHAELLALENGIAFIQRLCFQRIVGCRFNPLKVVLPYVVKEFAKITRAYELVYCHNIIDRNKKIVLPASSVLEAFFPFDPYSLRRSKRYIEPFYQYWNAAALPNQVNGDDDDDDDDDNDEAAQDDDDDDDVEEEQDMLNLSTGSISSNHSQTAGSYDDSMSAVAMALNGSTYDGGNSKYRANPRAGSSLLGATTTPGLGSRSFALGAGLAIPQVARDVSAEYEPSSDDMMMITPDGHQNSGAALMAMHFQQQQQLQRAANLPVFSAPGRRAGRNSRVL